MADAAAAIDRGVTREGSMPIYEYRCGTCSHLFSHFLRSIKQAEEEPAPPCPHCGAVDVHRVISRVAVIGPGGPDAAEIASDRTEAERSASVTPKALIDQFHSRQNRA